MSDNTPWAQLSKRAKDVFVELGTTDSKQIKKLKTADLIETDREARFSGYDKQNDQAYSTLEHELELRDSSKKWKLMIVTAVIAILGLMVKLFISD